MQYLLVNYLTGVGPWMELVNLPDVYGSEFLLIRGCFPDREVKTGTSIPQNRFNLKDARRSEFRVISEIQMSEGASRFVPEDAREMSTNGLWQSEHWPPEPMMGRRSRRSDGKKRDNREC